MGFLLPKLPLRIFGTFSLNRIEYSISLSHHLGYNHNVNYDDLEIRIAPGGCLVNLKVQPSSRKSKITGVHHGMLKVSVTAAPEKGRANDAVIKLLSDSLGIPQTDVEIKRGATGRKKTVMIYSLSPKEIIGKLNELPD